MSANRAVAYCGSDRLELYPGARGATRPTRARSIPPPSGVRVADQFGFNAQLRMSPELAIALVKPDCENCWVLPSAMTMFPAFT